MQIDYNAEDKENEIFSLSFLNLSSDVIFPLGSIRKDRIERSREKYSVDRDKYNFQFVH